MLFSATFTKAAHGLATTQLADHHVRLRVGCARSTHSNIKQDTIWAEPYLKKQACLDLLNTVPPGRTIISINNNKQDAIWAEPYLKKQACLDLLNTVPPGRTIIFVNNKHAADELDDFLFNKRVPGTYSVFTINRRRNSSYRFSRNGLDQFLQVLLWAVLDHSLTTKFGEVKVAEAKLVREKDCAEANRLRSRSPFERLERPLWPKQIVRPIRSSFAPLPGEVAFAEVAVVASQAEIMNDAID
ncbi:hypothetical protein GE21DRAFT_3040 [Neurospora crassa]|uniref:Uncharacterized protein n=1 Tax=Neurospora crassa (strain ATCC 24698 / 74-OR23-1A / CBS 708.71 / DSM 1257 / FGSC 987) TaxID=367110 RepID=Q7SCA5_NEUCR|nr:hypothetical protein NCU05480 [Neurospora crassa OR74A]EAA34235.3 hypothetical protein NCU05480 [Neurospora crassa OR74A]KHE85219.1 hypothetical protein GE21DRAFT_3040 [Neurospora crassa]|eukprot:XP_963471.3 hypothetical protein NCU05480 [Neurospora crassa OR74A]